MLLHYCAIPNHVNLIKMREILENHNLGFEEILNSSVLNQTSNFYFYFRPTTGICDCGTELGKLNKVEKHLSPITISKLEKKVGVKLKLIDGFRKRLATSLSKT